MVVKEEKRKKGKKALPLTRQIIIENNALQQVDNTLGVYIDQHLT